MTDPMYIQSHAVKLKDLLHTFSIGYRYSTCVGCHLIMRHLSGQAAGDVEFVLHLYSLHPFSRLAAWFPQAERHQRGDPVRTKVVLWNILLAKQYSIWYQICQSCPDFP